MTLEISKDDKKYVYEFYRVCEEHGIFGASWANNGQWKDDIPNCPLCDKLMRRLSDIEVQKIVEEGMKKGTMLRW